MTDAIRRRERLARLAGWLLCATVILAAIVAITLPSGSGSKITRKMAAQIDARVDALLAGIPESGTTLGSPSAPVTVTEYGDLECPVCTDLAVGSGVESRLIARDVRSGRVKLVYRSLDTASPADIFPTQQAAAYAAGQQHRAWYYIELFYREQGAEDTGYVTAAYLDGLAKQVRGLDYPTWAADRRQPDVTAQVHSDEALASRRGLTQTPTLLVRGPKGEASPITGVPDYASLEAAIVSVN
jgi:protein-disulfide isomerase